MLPNAVFSWAATRSGKGLGDFISSLTLEREEEWLRAYNTWRAEKGLKKVPSAPKTVSAPTPKQPAVKTVAEPEDELVELMESVADRLDQEAMEEAEELNQTLQEIDAIEVDEEAVPEEIKEEAAAAPDTAPVIDEHTDVAPSVADATPKEDATPEQTLPIEQKISKLAKDATPAIYEELLASMGNDIDALKTITQAVIRDHTKRHRGTAAQRAFLAWLEEKS